MTSLDAALACEAGRAGEAEYDILLYRGETQTRMGDYAGAEVPVFRKTHPAPPFALIVTAVEKKQMLLFNPGAHRRPRGRETA